MTINPNEAPADEFLEHLLGRPNFDATKIGLAADDRSGLSLTDHLNDAPARLQPHIHPWLPGIPWHSVSTGAELEAGEGRVPEARGGIRERQAIS